MSENRIYTLEELEGMRISELAGVYSQLFTQRKNRDVEPQIGLVASVMSTKSFRERKNILAIMKMDLRRSVVGERYEDSAVLRDMINDYLRRVLE